MSRSALVYFLGHSFSIFIHHFFRQRLKQYSICACCKREQSAICIWSIWIKILNVAWSCVIIHTRSCGQCKLHAHLSPASERRDQKIVVHFFVCVHVLLHSWQFTGQLHLYDKACNKLSLEKKQQQLLTHLPNLFIFFLFVLFNYLLFIWYD